MKKILLILLFTAVTNYPQVTPEWIRRNTDMFPSGMVVDKDGNVFITGLNNYGSDDPDYKTVKYNSAGVQQWLATYSFPSYTSNDHPFGIAIDSIGNVYVTGTSFGGDTTRNDIATVKYNSDGVQQWVRRYNGPTYQSNDAGEGIAVDAQGNVYVIGKNSSGLCTIKYSSAGDVLWIESPANEMTPVDLVIDESANIYITGYRPSAGYNSPLDYITIKYNSSGVQQWVKTYNGPGDDDDFPSSVSVDEIGNVYVTGTSVGVGPGYDYATIKYSSSGLEEWVARYNGPANDQAAAYSLAVNSPGDVYVTGYTISGTSSQFATVKYNSQGIQQWEALYSGPDSIDNISRDIALDSAGNVYVTGTSWGNGSNTDYITIKYSPNGVEQWVQRYDGSYNDQAYFISLDKNNNVYVAGQSFSTNPNGNTTDFVTIKYSENNNLHISSPSAGELWITGETDTIRWTGGQPGQLLALDYSTDKGQTYFDIAFAVPVETGFFTWQVPNELLTTKAKIKITDIADTAVYAISDTFKIKGYILTKYVNGNYDPYSQFQDPYAFGNTIDALWPREWWQRFDYKGIDPITGYSYLAGGTITSQYFQQADTSDFPDWISWVRTFGTSACYYRMSFPPSYSATGALKWFLNKDSWGGSCFGMSTSNVLLFAHKDQFISKYQSFPTADPMLLIPTDTVKTVINELYTHQLGKEHRGYQQVVRYSKTPNETLRDIKKMLIDDYEPIRTLSIFSNDPTDPGGHSIMAYKVEQDIQFDNIFYVYVYDNAYPELVGTSTILVDTLANNGNGIWAPTYGWLNWGGTKWFYLMEPATNYLTTPSLPDKLMPESPFILAENELQMLNTRNASILITDQSGNSSGYYNGVLTNNIPNAFPNIIENGSPGPPIGYDLPNADYSVKLDNYSDSDSRVGFFTGNKSYYYSRSNAQASEIDNLFFDAGLSYSNPDINSKPINFICIESEYFQDKAYAINNLQMTQNDSLKVEFADQSQLRIISYGNAKTYELSINFATSDYYGPFYNPNIPLSANTTHTLIPLWYSLPNNLLTVIVDEGNNGTIDDTLEVENQYGTTTTFQLAVTINNGWNMVSVPGLHPTNQNVNTWWSGKDPAAGVFRYSGGYLSVTDAAPGTGYWMKHLGVNTYNTGEEWPAGGIQIVAHNPLIAQAGWNLIGGYEQTVATASLTTNPPGLITGPIYEYSGGYQVAANLVPGYGYWVKLNSAGEVNITGSISKGNNAAKEFFEDKWGKIIITDAAGMNYTLYAITGNVDLNQYELPPAPPEGMFDVRFGSGRIAEDINNSVQSILFSGIEHPFTVRAENIDITLQDESGMRINANLKSGEEITISDITINRLMVSGELVPVKYELQQNYPNPFNPATTIKYSIAKQSNVTLKIYDMLGSEIATLVNEEKPAGVHETKFNAANLASGIYFYKIQAGSFVETKKMILLR